MSTISICTLVLEFNYSATPSEALGSVWLYNGDGSNDLLQDSPLDTFPMWIKIIGPVDYEVAGAIHAALKKFFEESGVSVIDQGIAD